METTPPPTHSMSMKHRFFFLLVIAGTLITLLSVYSVSINTIDDQINDLNTELIKRKRNIDYPVIPKHLNNFNITKQNLTLTSIFTKYLDSICLQNNSYPSDCISLLESMINISISLQLDDNEINILSQRIEYLNTPNHDHLKQPILYIHIPKTGGTGFGKWMERSSSKRTTHLWIPDNMKPNMFDHNHYPNAQRNRRRTQIHKRIENRNKPRPYPQVLYGHAAYGFDLLFLSDEEIKKLNDTPSNIVWKPRINYTYITILRHPISRVPSQYFYQKAGVGDENRPWTLQRDLFNWISWFEESSECLVQFISGCHQRAWYSKTYQNVLDTKLNPMPRREQKQSPDVFNNINITFDQYKIARNHLLMMGWIGLTEHLAESVDQLKVFWNEKTKVGARRENVGRSKPKKAIEQRIIDKIIQYNAYDIALWNLGYVMFLQQRVVVKYRYHVDINQQNLARFKMRKRGRRKQ